MFTENTPTEAQPEGRAERQLRLLRELAEIGMDIARAVRAEALAREDAAVEGAAAPARSRFAGADLGLVYSRVARAVRQTLALETRVSDEIETVRVERERRRQTASEIARHDRQIDIRGFVAEAIEAEGDSSDWSETKVERLLNDLDERLEDGDYDDTLADAPIADLVARICFDLGLTPDWRIWNDQDWAIQYLKDHTPTDIGAERWLHTGLEDGPDGGTDGGSADPPDAPASDSG